MTMVVDTASSVRKYCFNLVKRTEMPFGFNAGKCTDISSCLVQAVFILGANFSNNNLFTEKGLASDAYSQLIVFLYTFEYFHFILLVAGIDQICISFSH